MRDSARAHQQRSCKYCVAGRTNPEGVQRTEGITEESGKGCHTEMLESLYWLDLCYEGLMLE